MRYTFSLSCPPQAMVLFPEQGKLHSLSSSLFAMPARLCEHQHSLLTPVSFFFVFFHLKNTDSSSQN